MACNGAHWLIRQIKSTFHVNIFHWSNTLSLGLRLMATFCCSYLKSCSYIFFSLLASLDWTRLCLHYVFKLITRVLPVFAVLLSMYVNFICWQHKPCSFASILQSPFLFENKCLLESLLKCTSAALFSAKGLLSLEFQTSASPSLETKLVWILNLKLKAPKQFNSISQVLHFIKHRDHSYWFGFLTGQDIMWKQLKRAKKKSQSWRIKIQVLGGT